MANEKNVRRSSEEVKAARIEREERLALKAKQREERLAAQVELAQQKQKTALERKEQIENNVSTRTPKEPLPKIKEGALKRVSREVNTLLKSLGAELGLVFNDVAPKATRQGSGLSLHASAQVQEAMSKVKRAVGATREALRFTANHKLVGISPKLLGKEVELTGKNAGTYTVIGMKGRANNIVLQKVGGNGAFKEMPADEFKSHLAGA